MIVTYADDVFDWGISVEARLLSGELKEDVIRLPKLALCKNHKTTVIAQRVTVQLSALNKNIIDLFSDLLRAMYARVSPIAKTENHNIDAMDKEIFITVPQMWTPSSTRIMRRAAALAGIPKVELVYEPQAAAAFELERLTYHIDKRQLPLVPLDLPKGSVMYVADAPGGLPLMLHLTRWRLTR